MSVQRMYARELSAADVLIRGAHVLDPRAGLDFTP